MKVFKKYYMLFLLIFTLTVMGVYGTYAMFTHDINVDAVNLQASNIPVDQEISEYQKITVNANDAKTISLNISNSTSQALHYGAWYQMISPSTINDNITIAKLTDSPDETSGTIDGNSNKNVYIYIGNNSSSEITLYVGIKYSETSSLGLPDNRTLITNTRDGKYVVGVTVTNGTVENGVTLTNLITNGSFEDGSTGWNLTNTSITNTQHASGSNSLLLNANVKSAYSTQELSVKSPTINHEYYGKLQFLSSNNFTTGDARFEWFYNDEDDAHMVFAYKSIRTTEWKTMSDIVSIDTPTYLSKNWYIRNFVVNANTISYADDLVLVDLTNSYGNSYPSKEILDRSIGYFDGTVSYNYQKLNKGNSTTFKLTPNSGYEINNITCTNSNATYDNNTLIISNITGDVNCNVQFNKKRTSYEMLSYLGLTSNGVKDAVTGVATTNEGIWSTQDDYGTTYYFRGAVENNYVKFAGFYWRIIRINGNGSIRLIYDGTSAHANGESSSDRQIGTSRYNSSYNDNAYIGYMYGQTGASSYSQTHANTNNSTIKTTIDNWYKTNITDRGYNLKIEEDAVYCNDRSINTHPPNSNYNNLGYGLNPTAYRWYYGPWNSNNNITLKCPQLLQDGMSTNKAAKGNKALTYPVALITTDEVVYGGGWNLINSSYYLYTGQSYWTMSPTYLYFGNDYQNQARARKVADNGDAYDYDNIVTANMGVRPVISLKSSVTITGTGTPNDPFVIQ